MKYLAFFIVLFGTTHVLACTQFNDAAVVGAIRQLSHSDCMSQCTDMYGCDQPTCMNMICNLSVPTEHHP